MYPNAQGYAKPLVGALLNFAFSQVLHEIWSLQLLGFFLNFVSKVDLMLFGILHVFFF